MILRMDIPNQLITENQEKEPVGEESLGFSDEMGVGREAAVARGEWWGGGRRRRWREGSGGAGDDDDDDECGGGSMSWIDVD